MARVQQLRFSLIKIQREYPAACCEDESRVGWQAASSGAAKRIRVTQLTRIRVQDAPSLLGGDSLRGNASAIMKTRRLENLYLISYFTTTAKPNVLVGSIPDSKGR